MPITDAMILAFKRHITIINLIVIAMFFDKTYKTIFNHLFKARSIEGEFFGPLLIYFEIVEIND